MGHTDDTTVRLKSETEVMREICDWLHSQGYFFWRCNNVPVFGRALPKYTPRGLPDIMIVYKGTFVALEVKREGSNTQRERNGRKLRAGALSPQQAEWGAKLTLNGGEYSMVRSLDDAKGILYSITSLDS